MSSEIVENLIILIIIKTGFIHNIWYAWKNNLALDAPDVGKLFSQFFREIFSDKDRIFVTKCVLGSDYRASAL